MKVQGPGSSAPTSKSKKSGQASKGQGNFADYVTGGAQEAQGTAATNSIAQVDALLAIQGAEDPTEREAKNKMHARAQNILGGLETIRDAMLGGTLTVGHMIDVADVVASHRQKITDPGLTSIMDEIDLRAQVELAKMRKALAQEKT